MTLPGRLQRDFALKGLWFAAIAAAFAVLLGLLVVQTVRLEGLKIWPLEVEGWKPTAERLRLDLDHVLTAQRHAELEQLRVNAAAEKTYSAIANRIDEHAETDLARQLGAANRYIAAHRVRSEAAAGAFGRTGAATGDRGAEDPGTAGRTAQLDDPGAADRVAGAGDLVVVSAEDVRICTVNTIKAEAGHTLATALASASARAQ